MWLTFFAPVCAWAQDTDQLANEYLHLPGVQQMMGEMFSPEVMEAQFAASLPADLHVSSETMTKIGALQQNLTPKIIEILQE